MSEFDLQPTTPWDASVDGGKLTLARTVTRTTTQRETFSQAILISPGSSGVGPLISIREGGQIKWQAILDPAAARQIAQLLVQGLPL